MFGKQNTDTNSQEANNAHEWYPIDTEVAVLASFFLNEADPDDVFIIPLGIVERGSKGFYLQFYISDKVNERKPKRHYLISENEIVTGSGYGFYKLGDTLEEAYKALQELDLQNSPYIAWKLAQVANELLKEKQTTEAEFSKKNLPEQVYWGDDPDLEATNRCVTSLSLHSPLPITPLHIAEDRRLGFCFEFLVGNVYPGSKNTFGIYRLGHTRRDAIYAFFKDLDPLKNPDAFRQLKETATRLMNEQNREPVVFSKKDLIKTEEAQDGAEVES